MQQKIISDILAFRKIAEPIFKTPAAADTARYITEEAVEYRRTVMRANLPDQPRNSAPPESAIDELADVILMAGTLLIQIGRNSDKRAEPLKLSLPATEIEVADLLVWCGTSALLAITNSSGGLAAAQGPAWEAFELARLQIVKLDGDPRAATRARMGRIFRKHVLPKRPDLPAKISW